MRLVTTCPALLPALLLPRCTDYTRGSAATASAALIAAQALLHTGGGHQQGQQQQQEQEQYQQQLAQLLLALLPWTSHHNNALRTFAQIIVYELLRDPGRTATTSSTNSSGSGYSSQRSKSEPKSSSQPVTSVTSAVPPWVTSALGAGAAALLGQLLVFMDTNADLVRLRKALAPAFRVWRVGGVTAPRRVFWAGVQLAGEGAQEESLMVCLLAVCIVPHTQ